MTYVLSNQDTVLAQITQLESSITQTEVSDRTRGKEEGAGLMALTCVAHRR